MRMDMEKLVEEVRLQVPFKEKTDVGDTVLMLKENDKGRVIVAFANVLSFTPDKSKKDEWWHVGLVFLDLPLIPRTFILQTPHFTGQEIFTMGGKKVFIKAINMQGFTLEDDTGPLDPGDGPGSPGGNTDNNTGSKPNFTLVK